MSEKNRGIYQKYHVERVDGKPIKGGLCVVLEVGDPNTWDALRTFAKTVRNDGYDRLADNLELIVSEQEKKK